MAEGIDVALGKDVDRGGAFWCWCVDWAGSVGAGSFHKENPRRGGRCLGLLLYGESGRYQIHARQTEPGQWAFVVDDIRYVCPLGYARCETSEDLSAPFNPDAKLQTAW